MIFDNWKKTKTRQRVCLVATLDAVRETTVQGDRQVYHTITDVRSILIVLLSL